MYDYRSLESLGRWFMIFMVMLLVTDTTSAICDLIGVVTYPEWDAEVLPDDATTGEVALLATSSLTALWSFAVFLVCVALFCTWAVRANKNARALGAKHMKFTPGWAAGWFFVPIVNLFLPYAAIREIYQSGNPPERPLQEAPSFFPVWWGAWLVGSIVQGVAANLGRDLPGIAVPERMAYLAGALLHVIAGILAIKIIRRVHERQEAQVSQLGEIGSFE